MNAIGFNEARADSPGKFRFMEYLVPDPEGFNEARADSPGKSRDAAAAVVHLDSASMRPGRIRPGNARPAGGIIAD